jgi:hypothetical protein
LIDGSALLASLPSGLRDPLLAEYRGIVTAYTESRWKLTALDAGRFCEVVYTILDGALSGNFAASPQKPARFPDACRALESRPSVAIGDRSLRILIPRVLPALYEVRNNRDVGHVGGDVTANKMDAQFVRDAATWVLAELVRIFHALPVADAQASVDALVERTHPLVWVHDGKRRVLDASMSTKDKVLVLLYGMPAGAAITDLQAWTKYKVNFRRQVLEPLGIALLIECNSAWTHAVITPLGVQRVERDLLSAHP